MEKELIELVNKKLGIDREIQDIENLVCPQFLSKPTQCTFKEFEEYQIKMNHYNECVYKKTTILKDLKNRDDGIKAKIINILPASNIWFFTSSNEFAIGHESDDWPNSNGKLFIIKNPNKKQLEQLKHQIIN